ncbi:MAG: HAD family phosphatase [Firmicutes bacterium]|nr:HAD family phosphatase [Bacillota bacterium]
MKFKIVALDIDGTLLNSNSKLSLRTEKAIAAARQKGIKIVLATGRRLTNTLPLVNSLGLSEFVVVHNGAVVYDPISAKTVLQQGIELSLAQSLVDKLESLAVNYVVYMGENAGERVVAPQGKWKEPDSLLTYYLGEDAEFIERVVLESPPVRISIIDQWEKVDPLYAELLRDYEGDLNAVLYGADRDTWRGIEILPPHSNKSTGIAFVAEHFGLSAAEVVAIGDNINDLEMISWAGLGIAMENGSKLLKEKAKRIAPSNDEDGVALVIEELLSEL